MTTLPAPLDWSALPHLPSDQPRPTLRITPFPDEHWAASRAMIARTARTLPPGGRVFVMGAGACRDIPVGELADHFAEVVLCDIREDRLRDGVRNQKDIGRPERVRLDVRDLSDVAKRFVPLAEASLTGVRDPRTAVQRVGAVMDGLHPPPAPLTAAADLTVCSGVLTQVDHPVWRSAQDLLEARFGKPLDKALAEDLRGFQRRLGHRLRLRLIDQVLAGTRGGGRIYLADTMRVAHLQLQDGVWTATGAYRMGKLEHLDEYLDRRVIIGERSGWTWVDLDGSNLPGGRIWKVEALALTKRSASGADLVW